MWLGHNGELVQGPGTFGLTYHDKQAARELLEAWLAAGDPLMRLIGREALAMLISWDPEDKALTVGPRMPYLASYAQHQRLLDMIAKLMAVTHDQPQRGIELDALLASSSSRL